MELYGGPYFEVVQKPETVENTLYNQMVAMGRALVQAKKNMTLTEFKILIMALTKIKWSNSTQNSFEVELDKKEVAQVLGFVKDSTLSRELRIVFKKMLKNSMISFDYSEDEWEDQFLFIGMRSTRGSMFLRFNDYFRPLLENLLKDKSFVTIWANDIYQFNSAYAYLLFEELRLHCDTNKTNWRTYSTRELKELFGLDKDAYMRTKEQGGFNRAEFEKKVLDRAIAEINKGQMIKIFPIPGSAEFAKGKCYEKVKKNGYVVGYMFKYVVRTHILEESEEDEE